MLIDVVLPVLNEESILKSSVQTLNEFLKNNLNHLYLFISMKGRIMKVQLLLIMIFLVCFGCESTETGKGEGLNKTGYTLSTVPFNKVTLDDQFWKPRLETQVETLVPFALEKTIPAIESLELAGNYLKGDKSALPTPHRFRTSDLYKVMEGASYLLMVNRDPKLEKQMDDIIDIIADAQKEDGYLYVAHITGVSKDHDHWGGGGMGDKPYSFVLHSHEVYNMGHMYEGAIAYYQAMPIVCAYCEAGRQA